MAWTTPKTWSVDELLTAADLNEQLRDNMNALKSPPSAEYTLNEASDYSTSSTTFVDVDGTNLALTVNTNGGDVMVHFHGVINSSGNRVYLDVDVDGSRVAGDDGITGGYFSNRMPISFTRLLTGLSAGEHTFTLQWKVSGGSATMFAGAGSANEDWHPQFWVREVS